MKAVISRVSISEYGTKKEVRRDLKTLRALRAIWKGRKMPDAVSWQRRMRRDIRR